MSFKNPCDEKWLFGRLWEEISCCVQFSPACNLQRNSPVKRMKSYCVVNLTKLYSKSWQTFCALCLCLLLLSPAVFCTCRPSLKRPFKKEEEELGTKCQAISIQRGQKNNPPSFDSVPENLAASSSFHHDSVSPPASGIHYEQQTNSFGAKMRSQHQTYEKSNNTSQSSWNYPAQEHVSQAVQRKNYLVPKLLG